MSKEVKWTEDLVELKGVPEEFPFVRVTHMRLSHKGKWSKVSPQIVIEAEPETELEELIWGR